MNKDTICSHPFNSIAIKQYNSKNELTDFWPCCMMGNSTVEESTKGIDKFIRLARPGEDLSNLDPAQLFSHPSMESLRSDLINGKKPKACNICWEQEDRGITSFRQISLNTATRGATLEETVKNPTLKVIDMSINNKCNLRCRMCSPSASSLLTIDHNYFLKNNLMNQVRQSVERWGPASMGAFNLKENKNWQWISNNTDKFNILRLSGGEPFYNSEVIELLDKCIKEDTAKNITLEFHTNGVLFDDDELISKLKHFNTNFNISVEATGKLYEYIRYPAKWEQLDASVRRYIKECKPDKLILAHISMCINLFNVPDYVRWLDSLGVETSLSSSEVHHQTRGLSTVHLPIDLLEEAKEEIISAGKEYHRINISNILNIIDMSIKNNVGNRDKAKKELELFDLSRNQDYHDYLDPRICKWLDK